VSPWTDLLVFAVVAGLLVLVARPSASPKNFLAGLVVSVSLGLHVPAIASVEVVVKTPPQAVGCPTQGPFLTRNEDGTYTKIYPVTMTLQSCSTAATCRVQEWTDAPTAGGQFIRDLGPCKAEALEGRR